MSKNPLLVVAKKVDDLQEAILTIAEHTDRLEDAIFTIARKVDKIEKAVKTLAKSSDLIVKAVDNDNNEETLSLVSLQDKCVKQINQSCIKINGRKFCVTKSLINGRPTTLSNCVKQQGDVVGKYKD